jgi:hypothetical protein
MHPKQFEVAKPARILIKKVALLGYALAVSPRMIS